MNTNNPIKGYKVFNPDWTCRGKQYTCPGRFEENVDVLVRQSGMHFCKKASHCFKCYAFDPNNKVAEVVAYGTVAEENDTCCTDKLEIVREISWSEVLELVNLGKGNGGKGNTRNENSGNYNSGNCNSGNCNSGDYNSGNWNSGNWNSGNCNSGNYNSGDCNNGNNNSGDYNSGDWNSGDGNSGDWNSGDGNSGDRNSGNCNSGDWNSGDGNSGDYNSGDYNSGDYNSGDYNSGDWNLASSSNGCFNTVSPKIYLFDKPSEWTLAEWRNSTAYCVLSSAPKQTVYICYDSMTAEEREAHPEAEAAGGYLKKLSAYEVNANMNSWWKNLSKNGQDAVKAIPNFDPEIFRKITGIDVNEKGETHGEQN